MYLSPWWHHHHEVQRDCSAVRSNSTIKLTIGPYSLQRVTILNDNDSVRPPIINPYKKKAPASAPTSTGVATGRRQNNSTKSASQLAAENQWIWRSISEN